MQDQNIENLKTIKIDGTWYLGELVENEGSIEIRNAQKWCDSSTTKTFDSWIKNHNLGELSTLRCSKVTPYTIEELTPKNIMTFRQKVEAMNYVKQTAIPRLENQYYDQE